MLKLSLRFLLRDWRAGELNLLAMALIICVASITTVSFFTNRVDRAMHEQSSELLAADFVIAAKVPIDAARLKLADEYAVSSSYMKLLRSVILIDYSNLTAEVTANDNLKLVEIKAVDEDYPLRGKLELSDEPYGKRYSHTGSPEPGEVWVPQRLLQAFQIPLGTKVTLGGKEFIVSKIIEYEPDRGGDFFRMAPRLMMNINDLPATQLVQKGSRINHRLLISGDRQDVDAYIKKVKSSPNPGEQLISVRDGQPEIRFAFERAEFFLNIIALISVLLGSIATAMAAQRYTRRHVDTVAIMRAQGLTQIKIFNYFLIEMLVFAVVVSLIGCLIGYLAQFVLAEIMSNLIIDDLPQPDLSPLLIGGMTGLIALLGFVLPPIWLLRKVSPIRVLRRDENVSIFSKSFVIIFIGTIFTLWIWRLGDELVVQYILAGTVGTLLALYITARLTVYLLKPLRNWVGISWRYGLANLTRRGNLSSLQITAFGLGIMFILLNGEIRTELLSGWRNTMPANTPNYFITNVQRDQLAGIKHFFESKGIAPPSFSPMVRGRLIEINGNGVKADDFENPQAKNMILHEFNLSWRKDLPEGNKIIEGRWWQAEDKGKPYISLDPRIVNIFNLGLGDKLTFNIAGDIQEVELTNIRGVEWGSFQVNFFSLLPHGLLEDYNANWVTSLNLKADEAKYLTELVRLYPSVSIIDIDVIISRIRNLMDRIALAVEYLLGFTLVIGILIMLTALKTTQDERRQEAALLHTLGASKKWILRGISTEFLLLGGISGGIAGFAASMTGMILAEQVFKFKYVFSFGPVFIGIIGGAVAITIIGLLSTNKVLSKPPIDTFRHV
ncbi:ABC transporter, fused permease protein [hydrothermal vent metagenome]|uniref:ABC transporter, fused permease protein n=1 Tax=hydrothermal vent metagenome TaxID=652676 RepID=A0A3B0ZXN8_9ZZZZ